MKWCCSWKVSGLEYKGGNDIILLEKRFDYQGKIRNFTLIINEIFYMNTIQEYIELLAARNEQIRELQERISGLSPYILRAMIQRKWKS